MAYKKFKKRSMKKRGMKKPSSIYKYKIGRRYGG